MKNLKFTVALAALAGVALASGTAKATTSFNPGDVFLGVEDVTGTITNNYEVDLGNISFFKNATGTTDLGSMNADLTTAFGSGYASNANLQYGIIGTSTNLGASGYVANTIFISNPQSINGVPSIPYLDQSGGAQGTQRSNVQSFEGGSIGAFAPEPANGTVFPDATIINSSLNNSFTTEEAGSGFGTGDTDLNGLTGDSDLNVLVPLPSGNRGPILGSDLGYFSFSSTGDLLFTSYNIVSTPEPSVWALLAIGAFVGFWQFRRTVRA